MLVKQVANVLDLIEYFYEYKRPASLSEISKYFNWPRSSTFNIIHTLASRGYLFEPESKGNYYPTPKWMNLIQEIYSAEPLLESIRKIAQEVGQRTSETVIVGSLSGLNAVLIEVIPSSFEVRYVAEVGKCLPLYATATGQAILSQLSSTQRSSILKKVEFKHYGPGTPNDIAAVEESINNSLHRGWFASSSGYTQDLGGVSIPLVVEGRILAVTVAGPISRIEGKVISFAQILHEATANHLGNNFIHENMGGLEFPADLSKQRS